MNQLQADRMMTWAHFMESRVEPEELDMENYVSEYKGGCATVACAAGWLPNIFPDDWSLNKNHERLPLLVGFYSNLPDKSIRHFFGLTSDQADYITLPGEYRGNPTPEQVARRIRKVSGEHDWVAA